MPTEDAYSSGHLVLSHFGTCMGSNVETNLSWTCLVSGLLNFEHPSVLLFCFLQLSPFVEWVVQLVGVIPRFLRKMTGLVTENWLSILRWKMIGVPLTGVIIRLDGDNKTEIELNFKGIILCQHIIRAFYLGIQNNSSYRIVLTT